MYARVIACDFDGTSTSNGQLAPEFLAAVGRARALGWSVLLATGRILDDLRNVCGELYIFDAVVAENGAVVHLPASGRTIEIGTAPPEPFLRELRDRGVPFQTGSSIVATWESHWQETFESMRLHAPGWQLVFNRGAVMVLPSEVNKAAGVHRALQELRRSARNLIAFGDAENDVPLFAVAERAIAAAGSVPTVASHADERLSLSGGVGVARFVNRVLDDCGHLPTPARRHVRLGLSADGHKVVLPASGVDVMVSGDPRSGKSWLCGLIAEQLLELGYRLCVIDPEGDHSSLGHRPDVLCLGGVLSLPSPTAVAALLQSHSLSLVLSLNNLAVTRQLSYTKEVLDELGTSSAETGMPHWIVIDEAQYFFPGIELKGGLRNSNLLLSTYRPSLIADEVHARVGAHVVARTALEEERYFFSSLLKRHRASDLSASEALAQLDGDHVGLILDDANAPRWQVFRPGARTTSHTHHGLKYVDVRLSDERAFHFGGADGGPQLSAHNIGEFYEAVQTAPQICLRHHMTRADFSRWVSEVLGDQSLARGLRKLERAAEIGAEPSRSEILMQIETRYRVGKAADTGTAPPSAFA